MRISDWSSDVCSSDLPSATWLSPGTTGPSTAPTPQPSSTASRSSWKPVTGQPSCEVAAVASGTKPLHVRWLGRVSYVDAHALQRGLFTSSSDDHLLLLEHPHVYTLGVRGDLGHLLRPPAEVGAELVRTDRGGDVTYHGPGQLVGYPILTVPGRRGGGLTDTVAYVCSVEQLIIDVLADLGLPGAGRVEGYPGVWVDPESDSPRKICAIGVKLSRGRDRKSTRLNSSH